MAAVAWLVLLAGPAAGSAPRAGSAPLAGRGGLVVRGLAVDPRAPALPAGITAKAWVLADAGTGAVLAARDAHGQHLPASTIKILTALATLPNLRPTGQITVSNADASVDGTRVGLVPGLRYSVRELATAMLISSGNDAATALADAVGGPAATVTAMNALAARLGAHDTHVADPTGLDAPGQLTSAFDLAIFGRAALATGSVSRYLTIARATVRGRGGTTFQIQNHNTLLGSYPGTIGIKNGYTVAAQATYVGAVRRGGRTLIVTLLATAPDYGLDARALLDWGFAHAAAIRPVGSLGPAVPVIPPPAAPADGRGVTHQAAAQPAQSAGEPDGPGAVRLIPPTGGTSS
jgi:D-alanyl-D-alanine carboxypeptidase (penicillin-binding protein 5/6)